MADTGWKFPGTMVANRVIAGSEDDWSNENNVKLDDANDASVVQGSSPTTAESSGLAASNFDFSSIPAGSIIHGIEIRVGDFDVTTVSPLPAWLVVKLILADDSDGSENKNTELSGWTTSLQTDEAGGAGDLWGETITRADVQDVDFGFFLGVGKTINVAVRFDIDFLQMRIHYSNLPAVIISEAGSQGHHPPYKSSAGAFYVIVTTTSAGGFGARKATDPISSWSDAGTDKSEIGTLSGFATVQDGDIIHVVIWFTVTSPRYRYYQFNMATDAWIVTETIEEPTNAPTLFWASIAVRSDGDVVVVYNGDTDQVMGDTKERVDANVRTSGTWGGPIAIWGSGNLDEHFGNPNVVKQHDSDWMHIFYSQTTNIADPPTAWENHHARSLDPADDSASTLVTHTTQTGTALLGNANGISLLDGSVQRTLFPFTDEAGGQTNLVLQGLVISGVTDAVASMLPRSLIENVEDVSVNGEVIIASLVDESGTDNVHCIWSGGSAGGTDKDIYYKKSINDGETWIAGSLSEEIDGITCNFISANIYGRFPDLVLAYVYDDAGVQKYNEKVIGAAPAEVLPFFRRQTSTLLRM